MAVAASLRIVDTAALGDALAPARRDGRTIAFVPTMGALHAGHRSLLVAARERADLVVCSVYVNPTQFGPNEDFARYPRSLDADAALATGAGADLLWTPATGEIYPGGFATFIETTPLATIYEGASRPGHFRGVATVVYRLLALCRPGLLFIGQKDAQQCAVIETMVRDLLLPVTVVRQPTVRDADLVALSSRNAYLTSGERRAARAIPAALRAARGIASSGGSLAETLDAVTRTIAAEPSLQLDYVALVDGRDFAPLTDPRSPGGLCALAVRLPSARLIDNAWLQGQDRGLDA